MKKNSLLLSASLLLASPWLHADILHYDDVIITGSQCIGFDCADGESFGFDTIKLKEHNLRIYFQDTSYTANYPTNDWRIVVNDSTNGGASYLAIEDSSAGKQIFRVTAGAPANSLFVDSQGDVGLGTSSPAVELHVADGDTPTTRLEQNSSQGWSPQTWDIAGNETNFFIRDVTHGSQLPFRIRPGAPTSSIDIAANGNVGIGTGSPDDELHITGSTPSINLEDSAQSNNIWQITNHNEIFKITVPGSALGGEFKLDQAGVMTLAAGTIDLSGNTKTWEVVNHNDILKFTVPGSAGGAEVKIYEGGNMTITGTLTQGSSRSVKTDIETVSDDLILSKLADLEISTWSYKAQAGTKHVGPMAEDFYQVFKLGDMEEGIAPGDMAGVALAAIKGLQKKLTERDAEIAHLNERLALLEARLPDKQVSPTHP